MKKKKNSLLWRIEHPEANAPSYVFGTMHVRDGRAFRFREMVEQKITECEAYAAEVSFEEMNQGVMADAMDLPEGQTLPQLMKPKVYKRLRKLFEKQTGLPLELFDNNLPLFVSNLLTERLLASDMPESLDATLWNYARQLNKITLGIESFAEQLQILASISLEYQLKSLRWMVKNFKRYRQQLRQLTRLYEEARIHQLYQSTRKQAKGMRKVLLFDRNQIMAERIAQLALEQSLFTSVGAGHLAGKKGVLRLLKHQGFKVRPVF